MRERSNKAEARGNPLRLPMVLLAVLAMIVAACGSDPGDTPDELGLDDDTATAEAEDENEDEDGEPAPIESVDCMITPTPPGPYGRNQVFTLDVVVTPANAANSADFKWDMGNGDTVDDAPSFYSYGADGTYNVSVKWKDVIGESGAVECGEIAIEGEGEPIPSPEQVLCQTEPGLPSVVAPGETITLVADVTPPSAAPGLGFVWYMDNGDTVTGSPAFYSYSSGGVYDIVLVWTDGEGDDHELFCGEVTIEGEPIPEEEDEDEEEEEDVEDEAEADDEADDADAEDDDEEADDDDEDDGDDNDTATTTPPTTAPPVTSPPTTAAPVSYALNCVEGVQNAEEAQGGWYLTPSSSISALTSPTPPTGSVVTWTLVDANNSSNVVTVTGNPLTASDFTAGEWEVSVELTVGGSVVAATECGFFVREF